MCPAIKIEQLVYGGSGLGFLDRLPVFIPMTVPGDEVEFDISHRHKSHAEGRTTHIIKPSQNRVMPKCQYFGRCGGCQWQHMDYAAQILWKHLIVEEQLTRIGKLKDPKVLPTVPSPKIWNYRGRIKLHKSKDGGLGFCAAGSNEIIEIDECMLAEHPIDKLRAHDNDFFTQVNPSQNKNLQQLVVSLIKEVRAQEVLELYCGNGNLTFPMALASHHITASDSDGRAIKNAQEAAVKSNTDNISFMRIPARAAIHHVVSQHKAFDTLVVDPPRPGCKEIIKDAIHHLKPKNIIYVSCDPATLARDVGIFTEGGYDFIRTQPIDMFPQTYHIETVTFLARSS